MNTVEQFYEIAKKFCAYVTENEISEENLDYLISEVMRLYIGALALPEMEPEAIESNDEVHIEPCKIRINKHLPPGYWEMFNPLEDQEPVWGSLLDDLSDIVRDLNSGIAEYNSGRIGNAVFEWKFGLDNHWGQHAVDLTKALHAIRIS